MKLLISTAAVLTMTAASTVAAAPAPAPAVAPATATTSEKPTAAEAERFVAETEERLGDLHMEAELAIWVQANFITVDTTKLAALAGERRTAAQVAAATAAKAYDGVPVDAVTRRKLDIMKRAVRLPAPADPAKSQELAQVAADLAGTYSSAKWCPADGPCLDGGALEDVMQESRDPAKLLAAWQGWHDQARAMKPRYERMVELGREGARNLGSGPIKSLVIWMMD